MIMLSILSKVIVSSILASVAGSVAGTFISVKNMRFISGSLNHAIIGSIGISMWLSEKLGYSINPYAGCIVAIIITSAIITLSHAKYKEKEDAISSAIWVLGVSIGLLCASLTSNGSNQILESVVGNMLFISNTELYYIFILDLVMILTVYIFKYHLYLVCMDENFAKTLKINTSFIYFLMILICGLSSVILAMSMGTLLSMAFLIIPPTIALKYTNKIQHVFILSFLISVICSMLGITIAFFTEVSTSACIACLSGILYCGTALVA